MKKAILILAGAVALVVGASRAPSTATAGSSEYDVHDLRGSWGLIGLGAALRGPIPEDANPTQYQEIGGVVGRMTFDGAGNGTSANWHNWTVSGVGELEEREFTYEVNADGTGAIINRNGVLMYRFILVDSKRELYLADMRPGNVRARIAKKQ